MADAKLISPAHRQNSGSQITNYKSPPQSRGWGADHFNQIQMSYRPYFKYSIEQLYQVFSQSKGDLKTMKVLQYELGKRSMPKARALKTEVDELVRRLSSGSTTPTAPPPTYTPHAYSPPPVPVAPPPQGPESYRSAQPERLVVECGYCMAPNFISTMDGMQHLSCSQCHRAFTAEYKYGVLRTTFPPLSATSNPNDRNWGWLVGAGVVLLLLYMFMG